MRTPFFTENASPFTSAGCGMQARGRAAHMCLSVVLQVSTIRGPAFMNQHGMDLALYRQPTAARQGCPRTDNDDPHVLQRAQGGPLVHVRCCGELASCRELSHTDQAGRSSWSSARP